MGWEEQQGKEMDRFDTFSSEGKRQQEMKEAKEQRHDEGVSILQWMEQLSAT